jgi:predicted dehydrogenase
VIRIGILGLESSHADAYTKLVNLKDDPPELRLDGAQVTHCWHWDPEGGARTRELQERYGIGDVCDDPREMVGQVDAAMIFTRDGSLHREQAMPFLEAGIATFVDKPFAHSMEDARAMVQAARSSGAPLMSCSALRYATELGPLREALPTEVGEIRSALSTGPGELFFYGIHAAEVLHTVLGPGAEWVWAALGDNSDAITVRWADGRTGVIVLNRNGTTVFHFAVFGEKGWRETTFSDPRWYLETMRAFLQMVRTRKEPIDLEHTLEIIGILCAAKRSGETGGVVRVADL